MQQTRVPWSMVTAGAMVLDAAGVMHTVIARHAPTQVILNTYPDTVQTVDPNGLATVVTLTDDEALMLLHFAFPGMERIA